MKIDDKENYHIYDHEEGESFFIYTKSMFMSWLNDTDDLNNYNFTSTYEKMKNYTEGLKDEKKIKRIVKRY